MFLKPGVTIDLAFQRINTVHTYVYLYIYMCYFIVTVQPYLPTDCHNWMSDIESIFLDEHKGEFNFDKHGVTIIVPPGAITSGMKAELKFGAALFAPVKFAVNTIPVSAIFWFSMSEALQKPVKIQMEHGINIKSKAQANNLQFAKTNSLKNADYILKAIDGGRFIIGESFGTIEIDHFCYYCIQCNGYNENPPTYKYQAILFQNKQLQNGILKLQICIMASLATCKTVSILYYVCAVLYQHTNKNHLHNYGCMYCK